MKRIEIFSNNELLSEFIEEMEDKLPQQHFSIFEMKQGKGSNGEARGDSVWPEINFYCLIFTDSIEAIRALQAMLIVIKHNNPANTMKMFISDSHAVDIKDYDTTVMKERVQQIQEIVQKIKLVPGSIDILKLILNQL